MLPLPYGRLVTWPGVILGEDAHGRAYERHLQDLHRKFRSAARWIVKTHRPSSSAAAIVMIPNDPRTAADHVVLHVGDSYDLIAELVAIRDQDARQSSFAYVGVFDLTTKNREPRAILDMMSTDNSWLVGEPE